MKWFKNKKRPVDFDEILLDLSNLPASNMTRLEGRRELPVATNNIYLVGFLFLLIAGGFFFKIYLLQIIQGKDYRTISDNNSVSKTVIIAERGVVNDRNGEPLIWNDRDFSDRYDFPVRAYTDRLGLGQLLGYVSYPQKDKHGFYYRTEYIGRTGVESAFENLLHGKNGQKIVEVDALGKMVGEHVISESVAGGELKLSIDAGLSEAMYQIIASSSKQANFRSGAAAIMDVHTGEMLAMTSFPSYDPEVMADGNDVEKINSYNNDNRFPFLNKVVSGLYTPGSIVKPFVAYGALAEKIIDPNKIIVSNGKITIPNPYNPDQPSVYKDWRVQGQMTMREGIAFSSNVYFYTIGGGFGDQPGLGITKMDKYFNLFGLGDKTGIEIATEPTGTVPSPEWKQKVFGDEWRLGDTYFTAIGQYGFQQTPLQMLRAYAVLANGGLLLTPHVVLGKISDQIDLKLDPSYLKIIHEGMRKTVNYPGGTARPLERTDVAIAAKSGTAQVGEGNIFVNSWAAGFWPYEKPRYAFVLLMEKAPSNNTLGATRVMGQVFDWMASHHPEYFGSESDIIE